MLGALLKFSSHSALLLSARHHDGPWLTLSGGYWEESWEPVCERDIWLFRSLEAAGWVLVKGSEQRSLAEGQSSPRGSGMALVSSAVGLWDSHGLWE